jgi:cation:H+ antiporter
LVLLSLGFGLVFLFVGGDLLVRGAVSLAHRMRVSPMLIGITLVGFGTSTPELVTSIDAALRGSPGIAVGNVVGSNIANILLILGIAALIAPIFIKPVAFRRDAAVMVAAAVALAAFCFMGVLGAAAGLFFVIALLAYVTYTYRCERDTPTASAELHAREATLAEPTPHGLWRSLQFAVAGIALTIGGAHLLVGGAVELATALQIPDTVIGLTIVAVGTSLPELVASIVASLRRQGDIALGNVIGSNIYNILGILGVTAIVQPLTIPSQILQFDIWAMLAATALLVILAFSRQRLSRAAGAAFVILYAAYIAWLAAAA